MSRRALITGITGQDAAYLSKLLLEKGYEVVGTHRRTSTDATWRLEELGVLDGIRMEPLELLEFSNILRVIEAVQPDEIYNLAAQSFVKTSFEQPIYTAEVNGVGVARMLEAIRTVDPGIRFYQASTSEMYGKVAETPQNERTQFYPRNPYAAAKLYAHSMVVNYRESYGMHATSGILFNHESPLRSTEFVTRKITRAFAKIKHGRQEMLLLGNLDAERDWGFAGDYVRGIWLMLQQDEPDDYVLATGENHTIREFVECSATAVGFDLKWNGEGPQARGMDRATGRTIVRVDPALYRPAEVQTLLGDASKARRVLGWTTEYDMARLVKIMVERDLARMTKELSEDAR